MARGAGRWGVLLVVRAYPSDINDEVSGAAESGERAVVGWFEMDVALLRD